MLAGLFSGLTEAFVVNPFEVVKVRLQTDTQKFTVVSVIYLLNYKNLD